MNWVFFSDIAGFTEAVDRMDTGFCTVGNFGSEDRMDCPIIGGAVNLASRLENAAQPGTILISHETYSLVHTEFHCLEHQTLRLKGMAYP